MRTTPLPNPVRIDEIPPYIWIESPSFEQCPPLYDAIRRSLRKSETRVITRNYVRTDCDVRRTSYAITWRFDVFRSHRRCDARFCLSGRVSRVRYTNGRDAIPRTLDDINLNTARVRDTWDAKNAPAIQRKSVAALYRERRRDVRDSLFFAFCHSTLRAATARSAYGFGDGNKIRRATTVRRRDGARVE